MLQFTQIDKQEKLLVLNDLDNSIYFYNYPQGSYYGKIKFDYQGPNAIGELISFYWLNSDSVFLLNGNRDVLFIDSNKNRKGRYPTIDLTNLKNNIFPDPILTSTTRPMQIFRNELYMNGAIVGRKMKNPVPVINLQTGLATSTYSYPKIEAYVNDKKMETYYYLYSHCYNPDKNYFVFSFAADDSLRVTDFASLNNSYVAKTSVIGTIDPYLEVGKEYTDEEYDIEHLKKKYYSTILYDKYRKQYYRFFENSVSEKELETLSSREDFDLKQYGFLVLDQDFNVTHIELLPQATYNILELFVTEDGLCILNQKKCREDENFAYFDIF
jgi:hypothetical protein